VWSGHEFCPNLVQSTNRSFHGSSTHKGTQVKQVKSTKEAKRTPPFKIGSKYEDNKAVSHQDAEVLKLVLEATIVKSQSKEVLGEAAGVMFDRGSKYNVISKTLVARLKLEPQTEGDIRKLFGNKGFVMVDKLKEDCTIPQIRAYMP
jgi:hypothetical protein